MPRLTVLMPAFNSAGTIVQAVRSTLFDLPRDAAVHILDDASTDDTLEVLARLASADKRLKITAAPVNGGVAFSLNSLLAGANSEYVARMDADDVVIPGRFRRSIAVLDAGKAEVVFSGVIHRGPGRRIRPAVQLPISPENMQLFLLLGNPLTHSTMVGTTSALVETGGYRQVPSEDYDLWLRLALRDLRLRRIAQPGVFYRHHASQITSSAAWVASALNHPLTGAAHTKLCARVLGGSHEVYELLRRPVTCHSEYEKLHNFLKDVIAHSRHLNALQRADLRRLCAKYKAPQFALGEHHVA